MKVRFLPILELVGVALGGLSSSCHDIPTEPGPSTPTTATFVPLISLPGYLPYGEQWSPSDARMVYADAATESIAVFDASAPASPPLQVAPGAFSDNLAVRWSPDGGWLLILRSDGWPTFKRHLIAARIPGPGVPRFTVEVAPASSDMTHAVWGADGNIYWWDIVTSKRTVLPPPTEWRSENPSPFRERSQLLPRRDPHTGHLAPFLFETVSAVVETPIDVPADSTLGHVIGLDVVPGGQQFLLAVSESPCTFTALVDRDGAIRTRYWTPCPSGPPGGPFTFEGGGSVSADRRFVIGYREVEDGHNILSSHLILTDFQATWIVDVEGTAMGLWDAGFAATGLFLAFGDLGGGVKCGVLDVRY